MRKINWWLVLGVALIVVMLGVSYAGAHSSPTIDLGIRCQDGRLYVYVSGNNGDGTKVTVRVPAEQDEVVKGRAVFVSPTETTTLRASVRLTKDYYAVQRCG